MRQTEHDVQVEQVEAASEQVVVPTAAPAVPTPLAAAPAAPVPAVVDVHRVADDELRGDREDGQPVQRLRDDAVAVLPVAQPHAERRTQRMWSHASSGRLLRDGATARRPSWTTTISPRIGGTVSSPTRTSEATGRQPRNSCAGRSLERRMKANISPRSSAVSVVSSATM